MTTALAKEAGQLAQGTPELVEGTDTLNFFTKYEIPTEQEKDTTYAQIVCNKPLEKELPNRARLVVGETE